MKKLRLLSIEPLCAALAACGSSNNNNSAPKPQAKQAVVPPETRQLPAIQNDFCKNPFAEPPVQSLVVPSSLVRSRGSWVMTDQHIYMRGRYLYPDQETLNSLSPKLLEQLDSNVSKVNEIELHFTLSHLNWKNPPSGVTSQPYDVICSTMTPPVSSSSQQVITDTPTERDTTSQSNSSSGHQSLNSSMSLAIDAQTMVTKYLASMSYKTDGVNPEFGVSFPINPKSDQSMLKTDLSKIPANIKLYFIQESATSFYLRVAFDLSGNGNMTLSYSNSHSTNDQDPVVSGEKRELVVPTKNLMIFESHYILAQ